MSSSGPDDLGVFVSRLVEQQGRDPVDLLQTLQQVQDKYGYISAEVSERVAGEFGVPLGQVLGAVEFYAFLHSSPRGQYEILFSDSITDHMLGKQSLMEHLCHRLGVSAGETRADGLVSVGNASCTGMCDQGPAGLINGSAVTSLNRERIEEIADLIEAGVPLSDWPAKFFQVRNNIRRKDVLLLSGLDDGSAVRAVLELGEETVLREITRSGLRGLGGAGFKTGTKWALCRETSSPERYVVCNADEGEPGTFKDRVLLQRDPHRVFEGMTVCARVVGAQQGYLYLRSEYRHMLTSLQAVLRQRRGAGLLGENILGMQGFSFDIDIRLGAGAYVCGEESALLESLEGKRGVARIRPPFPVTHGFRNKPTVVNNVETFVAAAMIAVHGADWFAATGTDESKGTKLLSVSGDCERPGIYEYPYGVTIRQVLAECGAESTLAVQVAGAAGHCYQEPEFDRRIAFEDVPTGGSFMVFNQDRDMLEMARNFAHFFAHESCGFCTPCRVGTSLMKNLVDKVYAGNGTPSDLEEMRNLGAVMRGASQCGLGATAPNAIFDTLDKFSEAYQRRLKSTSFEPAFDLETALARGRA